MTDVRAAAQLSALASLLTIAVPSLITFNVIHATLALPVGLAAALLLLDGLGWRIVAVMFDRERLITGTPAIRGGPPARAAIRRRARHKRTFCRRDRYWVPAPLSAPYSAIRIRRDYMWLTLRDRPSKGRIADPRRKCGELSE